MGTAENKTNVMRVFDTLKLEYECFGYEPDSSLTGCDIARILGQNVDCVFKTLVTVGRSGKNYVFMIPVDRELDLKKAAVAAAEKSVDMLKAKDLLPLTGYVHGGCSPVGMKKKFATFVDASASSFDKIYFSAGRVGAQIKASPSSLAKAVQFKFADVSK